MSAAANWCKSWMSAAANWCKSWADSNAMGAAEERDEHC
jgi:hypothetical protein